MYRIYANYANLMNSVTMFLVFVYLYMFGFNFPFNAFGLINVCLIRWKYVGRYLLDTEHTQDTIM